MLVDSHCHLDMLDLEKYDGDLNKPINNARENGVSHLLTVCVELPGFERILSIAEQHDDISCSVGVHPNDGGPVKVNTDEIVSLAQHEKVVAIGETGLDFFRIEESEQPLQKENFRAQIKAAVQTNKPLIIHTRQAPVETIQIMTEEGANKPRGVMHCFTESWEMAKQALDLGFYISISGIVTFKNAENVREVAKQVPLDRLLVETDSPYLAPVPHRGKQNEPAYVRHVAEFIAELRGIEFEALANATTNNFFDLFKGAKRHV